MYTKTCEKCGWVFPITYKEKKCRWCGTPFKYDICVDCGEFKAIYAKGFCKECLFARDYKYKATRKFLAKSDSVGKLAYWLNRIEAIPKPIRRLTEEEWVEACRYFGKCAICNTDEITTRAFFVPFKLGGRYAAWNVIPVCDFCATELSSKKENPFMRYNKKLVSNNSRLKRRGLDDINNVYEYLERKLKDELDRQ